MGKPQKDLDDVNFIAKDLLRFATMSFQDLKRHIKEHSEDLLCDITIPGHGHRLISREAARRFAQLAKRQRDIDPNKHAISLSTLEEAIRETFVEIFISEGRPVERKFVDRMLGKAVQREKKDHKAVVHYLPCVIMSTGYPSYFEIGPVRFISKEKFFDDFELKIDADLRAGNKYPEETYNQILDWIHGYYKEFVWIAEVSVPACNSKISRERAEMTVQAAIDVLKLFFGYAGGRRFRLAQDGSRPDKSAHLMRGCNGAFRWWIGGYAIGGAFVKDDWYDRMMQESAWAVQAAGNAISRYLLPGAKSDHRDRWLDALNWYGQAVSERLPSAQLVKYVAALERLTVTKESGSNNVTDIVTRRTALLSVQFDLVPDILKARKDARTIYRWRSNLMHGRSSPLTKNILSVVQLADSITQKAIFGALALYIDLELKGKSKSKDLEQYFSDLEKQLLQTSLKTR